MTSASSRISLVLSDVDGTIIDADGSLTSATLDAAAALRRAGIALTLTSSRPPRGLEGLIGPLELDRPLGAFNGGMIVSPQLDPLEVEYLADATALAVLELLAQERLETWVYRDAEWFVLDPATTHVRHNASSVGFEPIALDDFDEIRQHAQMDRARVTKIVAVSDDPRQLGSLAALLAPLLGRSGTASRSSSYYLDVTSPQANKGAVVSFLAQALGIPTEQICSIGDMDNDVRMFERSGTSIAMGNAEPHVQSQAHHVTRPNTDEGFAYAMEHFVLDRAPQR